MVSETSTGSTESARNPPASRSISSPAMLTRAISRSCSRCPSESWLRISPVSASTRYAANAPASRRNSVLDRDTSPHQKPARWSRTSSTANASISRCAVSGRRLWLNRARYGSEKARVELLAVGSRAATDDAEGLNAGLADLLEKTQHVVLAKGDIGLDLLD